jgi:hypothetical protein
MHRTTLSLAIAATLIAVATSSPAQTIAYGEPPPTRPVLDGLAEHYRITLTSAWPQLPAGSGCENGGSETVAGTLTRTGPGDYAGTLTRTTHLLFCGAHGPSGDACALVLDGKGGVAMRGMVVAEERSPSGRALRVAWTPSTEHAATVTGDCEAEFKEKVERMYLTARHGVEFTLPKVGAAPKTERLDDYAWTVDVR